MMWKEDLKFFKNNGDMTLKRIGKRIKNLSCSMDWIGNNNDFGNADRIGSFINTVSNSKNFCFCACNIYSMMESFGEGFIVDINMRYEGSDVIFNASICDDESMREVAWRFNSQTIKLMNIEFKIVFLVFNK